MILMMGMEVMVLVFHVEIYIVNLELFYMTNSCVTVEGGVDEFLIYHQVKKFLVITDDGA